MNLKRSQFKRPVYERPPRSPVHPITDQRGTYGTAGLVAAPKAIILRSRPYRMWVATWPCSFCGIASFSQAAHENLGKAMQGKVCDSRIFPACGQHFGLPGCHYAFDNYVDIDREEARELGAKLSAQMRERAIVAGWVFSKEGITRA